MSSRRQPGPEETLVVRPTAKIGTEREVISGIFRNLRGVVAWKLDGLDDDTAKASVVESATTLLGIAHHLAWVEAWWFQEVFAGLTVEYPFDWEEDSDAEFRMSDEHTVESVLAVYERNARLSDDIIDAAPDLGALSARPGTSYSLRWIITHMIDETARHAGHMDIIREQLDGATGYMPA